MESRVLPKKSQKQSDEASELEHRKEVTNFPSVTISKSSEVNQNTSDSQDNESNEQVVDTVLRELPSAASRLDLEMRNQISSARGMTVEINTLRDLMPKLRKEIQTYTVNECQLVKELEKKLPSCHEHKDIRLNLILDEIQRLRINRRRTLTRLTESIVKVIGIQSRLEAASYDAGEIFWDRRISNLSGSEYQKLDIFTPFEVRSEGNDTLDTFSDFMGDSKTKSRSSERESTTAPSNTSDQGLLTELSMSAKQENFETREHLFQQPKFGSEHPTIPPTRMDKANPKIEREMNQAALTDESSANHQQTKRSDMGSPATIDIEDVIAQAQKEAKPREVNRRTAFLVIAIPAAVVGLLILDNLTRIISRSLFGG
jgi:hypothetical protein